MEEWKEYRLGELCSISSSKRIFAEEYKSFGIPFYRGKEIIEKQKGTNISTELYISESRYEEIKNKFGVPQKGDMLLTSVGTLGIPYIIKDETFYFKDGNLTWFYNFNGINSKFLYYWFLSPTGKNTIEVNAIGSTQKALTIDTLSKIRINIPNFKIQNKIVAILSSLDEKIELNRRINGNLEQQVQALFKAWFVDFEPFKNGKFVDSELGRIPEGWKVGQLDELVEIKYGKDHKKLLPGNIPVYGSGGIMRHVNMPIYEKESVLIPRKGSLNNVLYVNHPFWTVDTMFYTRMKINGIAKFIYLFISPIDLLSMNNGSAVPSMTTEILSKIRLVIPSKNIFDNFESLVAPSFDKIASCNKEICKLSNLRDTLLPKLLSGELSINTITE